ncbi:MAG TPA: ring-cleaving dioxygenase [Tepidisphaeraceae bacterium]|jgi:catechol 2,3-dioxygenase-like lactoylglutathione lyase family enzyme
MLSPSPSLPGIHHVTAITADAQKNIDFYCNILGLRLVKLTVNFDDPSSYHLYYGDELGRPGTVMTFFAWPGAHRGRIGPPQVTVTAFAAPAGALDFWRERLTENGVTLTLTPDRFGEKVLSFLDPDGMKLEIVATDHPGGQPWLAGPVPAEHAIRGFHGVSISEEGYENTAQLLTSVMNFTAAGNDNNRFRFTATGGDGFASVVDLLCTPDAPRGTLGAGIVHHVAFRTPDDPQQSAWRETLARLKFNVSPIMDRNYFHSIYYREPGGVLFEIATDHPGFTADEPAAKLGTKLMLPRQLEPLRSEIEKILPQVTLPFGVMVARAR